VTLGDVAQVASPTQYHVTLAKGQDEQHKAVVEELLQSVQQQPVSRADGTGTLVNAVA
jgi:hypothetical protein